jgi:hypothetical protein
MGRRVSLGPGTDGQSNFFAFVGTTLVRLRLYSIVPNGVEKGPPKVATTLLCLPVPAADTCFSPFAHLAVTGRPGPSGEQ